MRFGQPGSSLLRHLEAAQPERGHIVKHITLSSPGGLPCVCVCGTEVRQRRASHGGLACNGMVVAAAATVVELLHEAQRKGPFDVGRNKRTRNRFSISLKIHSPTGVPSSDDKTLVAGRRWPRNRAETGAVQQVPPDTRRIMGARRVCPASKTTSCPAASRQVVWNA